MKPCVVVVTAFVIALCPSLSHAQSRVSVELGGVVSAYDVAGSPGTSRSAIRSAIRAPDSTSGSVVTGGPSETVSQGIAAFEVRPTVTLQGGFLMGVGFRFGQAGIDGGSSSSLFGADVALGYQHFFGHFMPFLKAMFGLNSYDVAGSSVERQTDLRLDAVLGSRLYLSRRMYISASAFAGWGDRYGGSLSIGADIVQVFRRGVMP
ncbi:MAG: hypothetical protein JWM53_6832 [bacterium]|nr:hypothetical protein [bacterium]